MCLSISGPRVSHLCFHPAFLNFCVHETHLEEPFKVNSQMLTLELVAQYTSHSEQTPCIVLISFV